MAVYKERIGELPNDWEVVKGNLQLILESGMRPAEHVTDNPNDIPSLGGENIDLNGYLVFDNTRYISKEYYAKMPKGKIEDGDILINKDGANTGKIAFAKSKPFDNCAVNEHVFLIRNKGEFDQEFLFYFLFSDKGNRQIQRKIVGSAQGGINSSFPKGMFIPKPPIHEQKAIATLLSKVDEAIKATENSIKAAEKLKKSLMQNLLTGKLKPDGTWRKEDEFYKDEKFGNVPVGWVVKKGNKITDKITKGQSPKWQGFEYQAEGVLFVTSENVLDGFIDVSSPKYLPIEFNDKIKNSQLHYGDILINIVGASIGRCAVYSLSVEFANTNQAVCVFRPNSENDSDFIAYYIQLEHTQRRLLGNSVETARANLSLGDFRKFKFIIPEDKNEQISIATKIKEIDAVYISKHQKIKSLQRLKKSLMQNLLTGKVRVDLTKIETLINNK